MRSISVTSTIGGALSVLSALTLFSGCTLEAGSVVGSAGAALTAAGGSDTVTTNFGASTSMAGTTTGGMPSTGMGGTPSAGMANVSGSGPLANAGTTGMGGTSGGLAGASGMTGMGMGGMGMGGSALMTGGSDTGGMGTTEGGAAGMTGTAGSGMGGGASGECVKGQTSGNQVVVIGESFIAFTHQITQQIETRAQAAGSLPQGERYIDNSVSGTTLANNQIESQYTKAVQESGDIKYVIMDGGGNDCLINNNGAAALTAVDHLFETMVDNGTEKVLYFFYPDPIGSNFSSLKGCLDELRPQMKARCDNLTAPKCYWLDLRDVWDGHPEYTSDGIHPTTEGSAATGEAIWEAMVENCVAQ